MSVRCKEFSGCILCVTSQAGVRTFVPLEPSFLPLRDTVPCGGSAQEGRGTQGWGSGAPAFALRLPAASSTLLLAVVGGWQLGPVKVNGTHEDEVFASTRVPCAGAGPGGDLPGSGSQRRGRRRREWKMQK